MYDSEKVDFTELFYFTNKPYFLSLLVVFCMLIKCFVLCSEEEIPLPDVEPASFLALLKFLYSDEVQIGPETGTET